MPLPLIHCHQFYIDPPPELLSLLSLAIAFELDNDALFDVLDGIHDFFRVCKALVDLFHQIHLLWEQEECDHLLIIFLAVRMSTQRRS